MANKILVLGATGKPGNGERQSIIHDIEEVIGRKLTAFREYVAKANQTGI
ncbi:MAG TPA: hypothetical protein PK339_16435 [Flavitalea sp.]|nr:hypothetical protein [Flavitalea sp.]